MPPPRLLAVGPLLVLAFFLRDMQTWGGAIVAPGLVCASGFTPSDPMAAGFGVGKSLMVAFGKWEIVPACGRWGSRSRRLRPSSVGC